jgi:hypothetical protein
VCRLLLLQLCRLLVHEQLLVVQGLELLLL